MKKLILTTIALAGCALLAFADKKDEYIRFTDTIRAEVYALDLPQFKVKEIPDKYKNESSVIKAVYEEVGAKKKTGFGHIPGTLRFSQKAQIRGSHLTRLLVHINDKVALDTYSELDFNTAHRTKYWDGYEKYRHAVGVRIIKPDGTIKDIDTSEFVEVEEGKKGEKQSRNLAVPGLEVGDDIDLFYYTESKLQNVHPDPVTFDMRYDAPIMSYQIHCVVDDNLTTQYRTLNGAPDFTISRDEDKNYVLDLEMTDIEKEPRLWYNSAMQSPTIKMYIFNRRNSDEYTPQSARKDGLMANPDILYILEDRWVAWDWWIQTKSVGTMAQAYIRDGKKIGKTLKDLVKKGEISNQQAADYIYNTLCYIYFAKGASFDETKFIRQLKADLESDKIPSTIGISTVSSLEPLDQLANLKNSIAFFKVGDDNPRYYFPPVRGILAPSEIPANLQGRQALMWRKPKERRKNSTTDEDFFILPEGTPEDNRNVTTIDAAIDGTELKITRTESYLGATKTSGLQVLSEEDINEGYLKYLNRYGLDVIIKENKKEIADRAERYADGRKQQKEDFKKEIRSYHDTDAVEFTDGKVSNLGVDPDNPELIYTVSYTMADLLKRAGKNLILSTGKLLSSQIETLPSDRERADDVYLTAPREYVTRININIPSGYQVNQRSLEALNTSVSNNTGCFTVKAISPSGDTVTIEITKRYAKSGLPSGQWPDLLKILDGANDWQSSTLLLNKI